jgi:single-stranded-DNA-specific exonuclease
MYESGVLKRWRFKDPLDRSSASCRDLASQLGVDPLVASLLIQRGVGDRQHATRFLSPTLNALHDPALLPGTQRAAERIVCAVARCEPIVIYGDYDVDGITASAILWHVLRYLGADVSTYVPHRLAEGYGLNREAITQIASRGKPLIISVDCGVTATAEAVVAKDMGIDLIVTDHHEFDAANLPDAYAIVHPRLQETGEQSVSAPNEGGDTDLPSGYPFGDLCGAGVAFKLAWQIGRAHCGSDRLPDAMRDLLLDLLSLAALGTVADIVPLVDENRVITRFGLGQIKRTRFVGLTALIGASGLASDDISTYHVGFVLGPRLNACGRMGHARDAVHLLTEATPDEAQDIVSALTHANEQRRSTEHDMVARARHIIETSGYDSDDTRALVVGDISFHAGVAGIVASRLAERYARPAIVLAYDGDNASGSARSVPGVSVYEAIGECDDLLTSWGGHAMAAGLQLPRKRVDVFRNRFVGAVNDRLAAEDMVAIVDVDAQCTLSDVRIDVWDQIDRMAPFGRSNPSPTLCVRDAVIAQPPRRMGKEGKHLRMMIRREGRTVDAIAFGMGDLADQLAAGMKLDVVFEPKLNVWQGSRRAELHVKDLKIVR